MGRLITVMVFTFYFLFFNPIKEAESVLTLEDTMWKIEYAYAEPWS